MPEALKRKKDNYALFYRRSEGMSEKLEKLLNSTDVRKIVYEVNLVLEDSYKSSRNQKTLKDEYIQTIEEILEKEDADIVVELGFVNDGEVLVGLVNFYRLPTPLRHIYYKKVLQK